MSGVIPQQHSMLNSLGCLPRLSKITSSSIAMPCPTVTVSKVPRLFREPHILSGYRPMGQKWYCYLLSLFQRHNETLNVWTHLLAAFVLLLRWWAHTGAQGYTADAASLPLRIFLLSAVTYMLFSAVAHLFHSHSELAHFFFFFMDYVGVAVYESGCSLGHYFYSSEPAWRESSIALLFLPAASFLGWLSFASCCYAKCRYRRPYPIQHKICQVIPPAFAFLLIISPVVHRLLTVSWTQEPSLPFHTLQIVFFLLAAVFFSCPIPECFFPGQCDFVGHSHQIFHVFLATCTVFQVEALFLDYYRRRDTLVELFGEEQLWWACALFPALILCCFLMVLLFIWLMAKQQKSKEE